MLHATSPEGAAAFVPITPCRIMDTRPDFQVGPRSTPLGADETVTIAGVGTVGECAISGDATGLVLNVTALDATTGTFLTIWPAGETRPNASHLNPAPGQPPSPNSVTTDLGAEDQFSIYNAFGSVHVIADVVGFYTDHAHDDRYYTESESDGRYLTPAQADATYATIPTDHVLLGASDFIGSNPDRWLMLSGTWNYGHETADLDCLYASLELPEGATVTDVDLAYSRNLVPPIEPGSDEVRVIVASADGTPGPYSATIPEVVSINYYWHDQLPNSGIKVISRPALLHDEAALVASGVGATRQPAGGDLATETVQVCAGNALTFLNLQVNFTL